MNDVLGRAASQAVRTMWALRQSQGLSVHTLAGRLGWTPNQMVAALTAPTITLAMMGAMVEAMEAEVEIRVDPTPPSYSHWGMFA